MRSYSFYKVVMDICKIFMIDMFVCVKCIASFCDSYSAFTYEIIRTTVFSYGCPRTEHF